MRGTIFRNTRPMKFEIQPKWYTVLQVSLVVDLSQPNLHRLLLMCGYQTIPIFRKIIRNDTEMQPKMPIAFLVKDNFWLIATTIYRLCCIHCEGEVRILYIPQVEYECP
jgi:hypothetical protein